jgi:hypothetical protein
MTWTPEWLYPLGDAMLDHSQQDLNKLATPALPGASGQSGLGKQWQPTKKCTPAWETDWRDQFRVWRFVDKFDKSEQFQVWTAENSTLPQESWGTAGESLQLRGFALTKLCQVPWLRRKVKGVGKPTTYWSLEEKRWKRAWLNWLVPVYSVYSLLLKSLESRHDNITSVVHPDLPVSSTSLRNCRVGFQPPKMTVSPPGKDFQLHAKDLNHRNLTLAMMTPSWHLHDTFMTPIQNHTNGI